MLPPPNLSFTLPSIHDNSKLDCRVYHPACLNGLPGSSNPRPWQRRAAVVAHPYAPLGGCYDDPIVHLIASTLLQSGFVVMTFNFRGASSSGAHTSWTSKPERADYMSVAGFLVYYVHYLQPPQRPPNATDESVPPTLLSAGYSYGAMVTIQLPPLDSILSHFTSPATYTALADIRLRAQHLAEQQTVISTAPSSPRKSLGMRVGGDEDTSPQHIYDRPRTRSFDREERIRKGVRDLLSRTKLIQTRHDGDPTSQSGKPQRQEPRLEKIDDLVRFRSAYLVVSPPLGIATNLATMTFSNPFSTWSIRRRGGSPSTKKHRTKEEEEAAEAEEKFIINPALAIYGDQDGFLAVKKMRDWTNRLSSAEGSQFHDVQVSGAGHFWVEEGVLHKLREAVLSFATGFSRDL
ncbi:hypothetical protein AAE478_009581 [Parahypoxylon ruwenzoriense]